MKITSTNKRAPLIMKIIDRFFIMIHKKTIVHFIHIGKTGGTAVKYALRSNLSTKKYLINLHSHDTKLKDIPKGEKVIFITRDPISRFISGFYSRQRQGQPKYYYPWSEDEKIAFDKFHTPNELALALSSSDSNIKNSAIKAMKSIQHVRDSYWHWFENEDYFKERLQDILFIGSQENLSHSFEDLKNITGLPSNIELPSSDTHSHKNPNNIDKRLDHMATNNLKNWYEADYRFLEIIRQNFNP